MKVMKSVMILVTCAVSLSTVTAATEQSPTFPIQGKVGYSFMSDYMWRGVNMTKVLGGHEGNGAHEATYGAGIDLKDLSPDLFGKFFFSFQQAYFSDIVGEDGHLAKNDFAASYTFASPLLDGDWTIEYRNYKWQNVGNPIFQGGDRSSQELSAQFAYNDGELFKSITGEDWGKRVLNPTIKYIYDYEMADNGGVLIGGLSHSFELAGISPDLTGLSLTPSYEIAMDNRYYGPYFSNMTNGAIADDKNFELAYMQYGLNLGADISKMASMKVGKLQANVGIAFVNAFEHVAPGALTDTLYSYFNISYAW